jgi:hypothetical protein
LIIENSLRIDLDNAKAQVSSSNFSPLFLMLICLQQIIDLEESMRTIQGSLNQATDYIGQASVQADMEKKGLISCIDDLRNQLRGTS